MRKIYNIRQIVVSVMAFSILTLAFFKNKLLVKIIISPFLICTIAIFGKNLFDLLNKEKIANIFLCIFRITFFIYVFAFLVYASYYAISHKTYSLFIVIGIFLLATIRFFKLAFFKKK